MAMGFEYRTFGGQLFVYSSLYFDFTADSFGYLYSKNKFKWKPIMTC